MEIEVDAKVVVKWVLGRMCNNYAHSTLILYCKKIDETGLKRED